MKHTITIFLILICLPALAAPLPSFDVQSGDADRVSIELSSSDIINLQVYLRPEKLLQARKFISDNYKQQVCFQLNGRTISEPVIHIEPPFTGSSILLSFSDSDSAIAAAKEILKK